MPDVITDSSQVSPGLDTFYDRAHSAEAGFQQAFFQRAPKVLNKVLLELAQSLNTPESYLQITNHKIEHLMHHAWIDPQACFLGEGTVNSESGTLMVR